jgi:hypothetical protein
LTCVINIETPLSVNTNVHHILVLKLFKLKHFSSVKTALVYSFINSSSIQYFPLHSSLELTQILFFSALPEISMFRPVF